MKIKKFIINLTLVSVIAIISFFSGVLFTQMEYEKKVNKLQNQNLFLSKEIEKLKDENKNLNLQLSLKNSLPSLASEILDYKLSSPYHKEENIKNIKKEINTSKPQLVIIIDDMAFKWEVNMLKKIPYHITPSFFPPTYRHPDTDLFAREFKSYMIHLPLEAKNFPKAEENTLTTNSSFETIFNRLKIIKEDFPHLKYLNNHTGSTFTSDTQSMLKLFKAMKELNLTFIDSRTTSKSKAITVAKKYNLRIFSRDIFLDNVLNREYIRKQLKKAILIAKRRGYAIAIGHPHKITFDTIKTSKDLLKDVKVVYIDELKIK